MEGCETVIGVNNNELNVLCLSLMQEIFERKDSYKNLMETDYISSTLFMCVITKII